MKQMEKMAIREKVMQMFANPVSSEVISTNKIRVAGIAHLTQWLSLTVRVAKSERAAVAMQRISSEILRVEIRGSATTLGKWQSTSRLLRYRYPPVWNRPTDWSSIQALNRFARPAIHII